MPNAHQQGYELSQNELPAGQREVASSIASLQVSWYAAVRVRVDVGVQRDGAAVESYVGGSAVLRHLVLETCTTIC